MKEVYLIILSLIGFAVSFYIYYSKKYEKPMHCLIGKNCDAVVKSKYGKTFGVDNSIPGMAYYLLILAYAVLLLSNRNLFIVKPVYYFIVGSSVASVGFSLYLAGVQAFVLRKWCEYCIVSTTASVLILFLVV